MCGRTGRWNRGKPTTRGARPVPSGAPKSFGLELFDPVQPPSPRHALELVNAAILEANSGLRHQIRDRARDQNFASTCFRRYTRADVKRETDHLAAAHFEFAH